MPYQSIILKYPVQPLFELLRHPDFPTHALEHFLTDLLSGNEEAIEQLRPWIETGQPRYKTLLHTPAELAFDELTHQSKDWLNYHRLFFEETLRQALLLDERDVLNRLKTLVAESGAGIGAGFLRRMLEERLGAFSPLDEIDLWILFAKLQENLDALNPLQFEQELYDQLADRPWLLIVLIYVFREKKPEAALRLLNRWDEQNYQPSEDMIDYVSVYLRHALYQLLHEAGDEKYNLFFNLLHSLGSSELRKLLKRILHQDGMREIADEFDKRDHEQEARYVVEQMRVRNELDTLLN